MWLNEISFNRYEQSAIRRHTKRCEVVLWAIAYSIYRALNGLTLAARPAGIALAASAIAPTRRMAIK